MSIGSSAAEGEPTGVVIGSGIPPSLPVGVFLRLFGPVCWLLRCLFSPRDWADLDA